MPRNDREERDSASESEGSDAGWESFSDAVIDETNAARDSTNETEWESFSEEGPVTVEGGDDAGRAAVEEVPSTSVENDYRDRVTLLAVSEGRSQKACSNGSKHQSAALVYTVYTALKAAVGQVRRLDCKGVPTELGEKSSEVSGLKKRQRKAAGDQIIGLCINYRGGPRISEDAPKKWNKPRASCDLVRFAHEYEATLGSNPYAQKPIFSSLHSRLHRKDMKISFIVTIPFITGVAVGAPCGDSVSNDENKLGSPMQQNPLGGHPYDVNDTIIVSDMDRPAGGQVGDTPSCIACLACLAEALNPFCWSAFDTCGL
ncbi:hypothetical protein FOZ61_004317 [Perkinsus olseni]|uniref:Uncharacterized protein n=1 Tax=Perkinsus olseni TaxID=32597 RepID=A0A7J6LLE9_PEROL|nr:hypothetical protein FOZ61_004317 [Perkinsus olseni]